MKRVLLVTALALTFSSLSAQAQDYFSRNVVAPVFGSAGVAASTCAAPGVYLSSLATTGIAFTATPSVLLCLNGVAVGTVAAGSFTSTVPWLGPDGTVANPAYGYTSTAGLGWRRSATSEQRAQAQGADVLAVGLSSGANGYIEILANNPTIYMSDVTLARTATANQFELGNDDRLRIAATGLATTSTTGLSLENLTAATGAATVQMSPRTVWRGNAWDTAASQTVDFFAETLPATAATPTGQWKLGYSLNGAAATYPLTVSSAGRLDTLTTIQSGGHVGIADNFELVFAGGGNLASLTDGLFRSLNSAETFGIEINAGTAAPTFNNGTITTGSRNSAGQITLTGGNTGGVITFGAPNWTNAPFCTLTGSAATDIPQITAVSVSALTVAGITANGVFTYICLGRI